MYAVISTFAFREYETIESDFLRGRATLENTIEIKLALGEMANSWTSLAAGASTSSADPPRGKPRAGDSRPVSVTLEPNLRAKDPDLVQAGESVPTSLRCGARCLGR